MRQALVELRSRRSILSGILLLSSRRKQATPTATAIVIATRPPSLLLSSNPIQEPQSGVCSILSFPPPLPSIPPSLCLRLTVDLLKAPSLPPSSYFSFSSTLNPLSTFWGGEGKEAAPEKKTQ